MPRIRRDPEKTTRSRHPDLVRELVEELRHSRDFGQPLIEELCFPKTNNLRVQVIWDKWDPISDEDRYQTILEAYQQVEGKELRDRIALAIGLTVPEAQQLGLLPFQVVPMVRKGDPVTLEQCREAMLAQGASILFDPGKPQLRYATREEAEACKQRLSEQLPGSEPVWAIAEDVMRHGIWEQADLE